jgi:HSP20 family molecular chaperone IbpA
LPEVKSVPELAPDGKNVDVKIANGMLTIRGEKQVVKEEGKQDYRVRERSFGSFECSFQVPGGPRVLRLKKPKRKL